MALGSGGRAWCVCLCDREMVVNERLCEVLVFVPRRRRENVCFFGTFVGDSWSW